jgi:hypothetical protein
MNGELFPAKAVTMLSPRLQWCKDHAVVTTKRKGVAAEHLWSAHVERSLIQGVGPNEEDACRDLAVKLNIKLWFEREGY